jgi:hypothetical protein
MSDSSSSAQPWTVAHPHVTRSARLFLERHGLAPTYRGPTVSLLPASLSVLTFNGTYTIPDALRLPPPVSYPDGGVTQEPWPAQ